MLKLRKSHKALKAVQGLLEAPMHDCSVGKKLRERVARIPQAELPGTLAGLDVAMQFYVKLHSHNEELAETMFGKDLHDLVHMIVAVCDRMPDESAEPSGDWIPDEIATKGKDGE